MSPIGTLALAITFGTHLVGGFTRLTHGRYTPSFYAYQLDRAPNDASPWFVPYIDLVFCAMMVAGPGTRMLGLSLSALTQFFGIFKRVREDKEAAVDLALVCCAIVATLDCLFAGS
ncbi:hypothetical protein M406DRAFT_323833 [Cryphonectria parasitica EP155]|uniref:Uncharacterized protein n=1 Tax=Cryphonectria parasitica (strain ATCC 38755 / EP155) TaxID=660469 RepID=A0A9P5CJL5_CRYP1|nr:uncharacterized protein M406DRAFT_323833 [Cryphonectria parasitica EP155]KAF3761359.1 hypothetical protein M406DRAFT_323833 [Cryphonectria parasitica EP155]